MTRLLVLCYVLATGLTLRADAVDYPTEVLPIMKEHCWDCHSNETEVKGNVALDPDVLFHPVALTHLSLPTKREA